MKRNWFQFIRKESEAEDEAPPKAAESDSVNDATRPAVPPTSNIAAAPTTEAESPAQPAAPPSPDALAAVQPQEPSCIALRMTGDLWTVPPGHHRKAVVSGGIIMDGEPGAPSSKSDAPQRNSDGTVSNSEAPRLFPCALSLDVGEMRRVDGRMTEPIEERHSFLAHDIPVSWHQKLWTSLIELHIGDLIVDIPEPGAPSEPSTNCFACGTALLRWAVVSGSFFGEAFRLRMIEIERMQLIQADTAWFGQFFQVLSYEVEGAASRTLAQQFRAAGSLADLAGITRRTALRYARASS